MLSHPKKFTELVFSLEKKNKQEEISPFPINSQHVEFFVLDFAVQFFL